MDDVLIIGRDMDEHNARFRIVLEIIKDKGLRKGKEKGVFGVTDVEYL